MTAGGQRAIRLRVDQCVRHAQVVFPCVVVVVTCVLSESGIILMVEVRRGRGCHNLYIDVVR